MLRSSSEDSADEDEDDEQAGSTVGRERREENSRTRDKMKAVRNLMETRTLLKAHHNGKVTTWACTLHFHQCHDIP